MKTKTASLLMAPYVALTLALFASAQAQDDIVAKLSQSNQHQTLTRLIKEAGLEITLKGKGPFTLFAPTDAAFAKLPVGAMKALSADKKLLAHVLRYHVATGRKTAKLLRPGPVANLAKYDVVYHVENGQPMINTARITATDKLASNGVIHVIDTALMTRKALDELRAKGIKL
jgi:uncharacterized surface protein with fasciclin (FAS1) repeats